MKRNAEPDDEILTAYALGELSREDAAEVERLLADNDDARRFVSDTRELAANLTSALSTEEADLLPEQKQTVLQAASNIVLMPQPRRAGRWMAAAGIAAAVVLGIGLYLSKQGNRIGVNEMAAVRETPSLPVKADSTPMPLPVPSSIPAHSSIPIVSTSPASAMENAEASSMPVAPAAPVVPELNSESIAMAEVGRDKAEQREEFARRELQLQLEITRNAVDESVEYSKKANSAPGRTTYLAGTPASGGSGAAIAPAGLGPSTRGNDGYGGAELGGESKKQDEYAFNNKAKGSTRLSRSRLFGMAAETESGRSEESYNPREDGDFADVTARPLSTFSIDVDSASYTNVRRFLSEGSLPPRDAVRTEELINYFAYNYPQPKENAPFSVNVDIADAPWNPDHKLARIGLKGRVVPTEERPPGNLVFLIDVSGSMAPQNKLPLVRDSLSKLVDQLSEDDRVAIVTYAGESRVALKSTPVAEKSQIRKAIRALESGGSTNGEAGIETAYEIAVKNFREGGTNRVILCTDGDFNVGISSQKELVQFVSDKAKAGIHLTVLGFGMGNLKDGMLEQIADKGDGTYGYIDTSKEAHRLFVEQLSGTLVTIAKDVKIQVEFNPAVVGSYRLIGYENRVLAAKDFNDDRKDAGEIGAGHSVTALYELIPAVGAGVGSDQPLKYASRAQTQPRAEGTSDEWMTVKLRYKAPDGGASKLIEQAVPAEVAERKPSADFQFAASVAQFGMLLRNSEHKGDATWESTMDLAEPGLENDPEGHRAEYMELVRKAQSLGR